MKVFKLIAMSSMLLSVKKLKKKKIALFSIIMGLILAFLFNQYYLDQER